MISFIQIDSNNYHVSFIRCDYRTKNPYSINEIIKDARLS